MLCGPRCKVYSSPNREEYHRLYLKEHHSFHNLMVYAREKKGEKISQMSFWRHFTKHISPLVDLTSQEEEAFLYKKAEERLNILEEIESNLLTLKKMSDDAVKLPMNAANINAFVRLSGEFRMTLEYLDRYKESYTRPSERLKEENIIPKIMEALQEIPEEYRIAVLKKMRVE